ncbi:hypothetical protein DWX66_13885 [Phocaeicola vulgatus]|nr:hypothetical protein DWX66_13885 [Phocaeicola vulgatus]
MSAFHYKIVYICFYNLFKLNAFINAEEFPAFHLFGKRGTLLISCGILSPVYQTFALFVVYAAFPHLTLL